MDIANNLYHGTATFGDALEAIKQGARCQRAGWNGKGMWIALTAGSQLDRLPGDEDSAGYAAGGGLARVLTGAVRQLAETEGPPTIRWCSHIDMRAADGSIVIGWLASQTDMLAEDWRVL